VKIEGPQEFTAIPYYAWAHRGNHQMTVWPARETRAAKPLPASTLAFRSKVTVSGGQRPEVLTDQLEPKRSFDESLLPFHWWPKKGTQEWVQFDFPEKSTVSRVSVYWFDDTGVGETRLPKSWRVLYREGSGWKLLPGSSQPAVEKDRLNTLACTPVQAEGVRIEVQLQEGFSAGIHEVVVE
jgi:hypothetical protein